SSGAVTLTREPTAPAVSATSGCCATSTSTDGVGDLGLVMVGWDHTGMYTDGKGRQGDDASPAYLAAMRTYDLDYAVNPPSGRDCGENPLPSPERRRW